MGQEDNNNKQAGQTEEIQSTTSMAEHPRHNRIKSVCMLYAMCMNASVGIIFLGFNQGVFNVVQLIILELKGIDDEDERSLYSALMSSFNPLGGLIGALVGTYVLKYCNSLRRSFFLMDLLGIIGTICILVKIDIINIVIGRFIQGLAAGVNLALVPIYIKEFSPIEILGKTGSFVQLGQKGGLVCSYLFGLILPSKHWLKEEDNAETYDNEYEWRIVICVPIVFCLLRSLLLLTCFRYDTPNEALQRHHEDEVKRLYHLIYKEQDFDDAYQKTLKSFHEMQLRKQIKDEEENDNLNNNENNNDKQGVQQNDEKYVANSQTDTELKEKAPHPQFDPNFMTESEMIKEEEEFERVEKATKCRRRMLGWMISLTVSFSGIDAIFYYSNKILEDGGLEQYATFITIMIGISCILFSFIGMSLVDQAGRRPLLIGGSFIMTISLVGLVVGDIVDQVSLIVACIILFMFGYNSTLGPIKFACYVELMDPFGVSVAASLIFVFAFVIALAFPFMVQGLKLYGAFSIFLGLSVLCLIYLTIEFKETKGKTKLELYPLFLRNRKQEKKKKTNYHQNVNILEVHGMSQMNLNFKSKNRKSQLDMNSIHKSFRQSLHQSMHEQKFKNK